MEAFFFSPFLPGRLVPGSSSAPALWSRETQDAENGKSQELCPEAVPALLPGARRLPLAGLEECS